MKLFYSPPILKRMRRCGEDYPIKEALLASFYTFSSIMISLDFFSSLGSEHPDTYDEKNYTLSAWFIGVFSACALSILNAKIFFWIRKLDAEIEAAKLKVECAQDAIRCLLTLLSPQKAVEEIKQQFSQVNATIDVIRETLDYFAMQELAELKSFTKQPIIMASRILRAIAAGFSGYSAVIGQQHNDEIIAAIVNAKQNGETISNGLRIIIAPNKFSALQVLQDISAFSIGAIGGFLLSSPLEGPAMTRIETLERMQQDLILAVRLVFRQLEYLKPEVKQLLETQMTEININPDECADVELRDLRVRNYGAVV